MNYPTLGFLGTGMMASAAITGFCEVAKDKPYPIVVANRSIDKAKAIADKYPNRVTLANSFQECVDKSDWVILAVLPNAAKDVLKGLEFRSNHKIISFVFSMGKEEIEPLLNTKIEAVVHMIPGTFVSVTPGPIVQRPPHKEASEIISAIGKPVAVESREDEKVLISLTSMFAPVFSVHDTLINWCEKQGLDKEIGTSYVTALLLALCEELIPLNSDDIHRLATVNTPGGINMQAVDEITKAGGYKAFEGALDNILNRINGL